MPARARPVPFWRHGFLVECLTVCAVLLGARALARVGLEGDDDLVHQRFVVVAAEHGVGRVDLRRRLALFVQEFELHHLAPFLALSLDGRTARRTWPFFEPGTAPRTSSSWRASSMRTTSRFCVVVGLVAEVARHVLAREHAARVLRHRDRARHVVRTAVAVRRALRAEVVALDGAGEALADRGALHVDLLARRRTRVTGTVAPAGIGRRRPRRRGIPSGFRRLRRPPWRGGRLRAWSRARPCACRT